MVALFFLGLCSELSKVHPFLPLTLFIFILLLLSPFYFIILSTFREYYFLPWLFSLQQFCPS